MTTKEKRRDSHRVVLKVGESEIPNGTYCYRWTDGQQKRHAVYAKTLDALRIKEESVVRDTMDGIKAEARNKTINEIYEVWLALKRGLKDNTRQNYKYMYDGFVRDNIGQIRISRVKKSDIKRFYNYLADERGLKISTIDSIHTVLHQVLQIAVDDEFIRKNPCDGVLNELKKSRAFESGKRKALTQAEETLLLNFLKNSPVYVHWYPLFVVLLRTGLRIGEATGLRWCDVDMEKGIIDVNHTLVYYCHREDAAKNGCYFNINTPKTANSVRKVPMLDSVREALQMEKQYQREAGIRCSVIIDGYTNFIFVNRFGKTQHQGTVNKAIRRIIRDCNDAEFEKNSNPKVLLPQFSCHSLRHTFTTRMCEAGVNVKVIQSILGHKDITTTLNIYADVTKEMEAEGVKTLSTYFREMA